MLQNKMMNTKYHIMSGVKKGFSISLLLALCYFAFSESKTLAQSNSDKSNVRFDPLLLIQETVWLNPERTIYMAGEDINLTAEIFEVDTYRPSKMSKLINLELIKKDGTVLHKGKYRAEDGRIIAAIHIPARAESDWYFLRSYTQWMRNYPSDYYTILPIKIVNPNGFTSERELAEEQEFECVMYAEWDKLVADRENNVSVFIHKKEGEGIAGNFFLINQSGDSLLSFTTEKTGWTSFKFTPEKDKDYGIVKEDGSGYNINTHFPEIIESFPLLEVVEERRSINLNIEFLESLTLEQVKLIIHGRYSAYWFGSRDVRGTGSVSFAVPYNAIPDGVHQFSLLNEDNELIASRLFSISPPGTYDGPEIIINDTSLAIHKEFSLEIAYPGIEDNADRRALYQSISLSQPGGLYDDFLPGIPGWYFSKNIPATNSGFNAWLLANRYDDSIISALLPSGLEQPRKIKLDQLSSVSERALALKYLPETRGVTLTGSVINSESGEPVPNIGVSLSMLKSNDFYSFKSMSNGRFWFSFPEIVGSEDILVTLNGNYDLPLSIKLDAEFDKSPGWLPNLKFSINNEERDYLEQLSIHNQLEEIYSDSLTYQYNDYHNKIENDTLDFYGEPDRKVYLTDYVDLLNLREVVFEIVPGVFVKLIGEEYSIYVIGDHAFSANYIPLILVDGIPFNKFNALLELHPTVFSSIEVKYSLFIHGNSAFAGIVNFKTVNRDLGGLNLPHDSRLIKYQFGEMNSGYVSFLQDSKDISPGISRLMLYDYSLPLNYDKLLIKSNDITAKYDITIFGFDSDGNWINEKKSFHTVIK